MTDQEYNKLQKLRKRHGTWKMLKFVSLSQMVGAIIVSTFYSCSGEPGILLGVGGIGLALLFEQFQGSAKQSLDAFEARFEDEK